MSLELKAELVMAVEDYECEEEHRWDGGVDFTASDAKSDEKVLLRVIIKPKSKSGFVGVDSVSNMVKVLKDEDYDRGVLISKRYTAAAKRKLLEESIQMVTEDFIPRFEPQEFYLAIKECVDDLCKSKCGGVPEKESDCKGYSDGYYSCRVRLFSDNASFHLERGWINLLKNDLMRLLALQHSMNG